MRLWVARDLDGTLGLFDGDKPKPILGEWMPDNDYYSIDNRLFPEVTYENSPQEIEIVIKK